MRYKSDHIRLTILEFIKETQQNEIIYVIPFCLGYFGYITNQIWNVINGLIHEGKITLSRTDEP